MVTIPAADEINRLGIEKAVNIKYIAAEIAAVSRSISAVKLNDIANDTISSDLSGKTCKRCMSRE